MANGTKVTNLGLGIITAALLAYANVAKYIGWGTGTTTPAVTDVDLVTPGGHEARTSGAVTQQTTTATDDTLRVVGTITCLTSGKAITEAGLWDATDADPWQTPAGNLFCRTVFSAINVAVSDGIQFTWNIVFSDNS